MQMILFNADIDQPGGVLSKEKYDKEPERLWADDHLHAWQRERGAGKKTLSCKLTDRGKKTKWYADLPHKCLY